MSHQTSSLSKTAPKMAIYPHQTAWIQRVSRMSLEAANEVVLDEDATTNVRPTGLRVNTNIRSRVYHEKIAQAHLNEKGEGKDYSYDDDVNDSADEGYLHANGNLEKYMEDLGRLRSLMRDEEEEMEDRNADDNTAASDHVSAGNSPPKDGNEGDPSSSPSYRGGGIKLKRNNSNSAELMLKGVSSRSPTPSQSPQSPSETSGYSLDGYFESCEECFVAGIRCVHCTGPLRFVTDGRGSGILTRDRSGRGGGHGHGDGRATSERHEWLVGRMNESLAKIDCAGKGGSGGVMVPKSGA